MKKGQLLVLVLITLVLFGTIARFFLVDNEFSGEETSFINAAKAIKESGKPVYYESEQNPKIWALWHPPMYIYLLSFILDISYKEIALRSLNIMASLLIALIIFLFCKKLINQNGREIGLISAALFMINYYAISSSNIIDIDVIATLFLWMFIFFILISFRTNNKFYKVFSVIFLFFSLANRYPIAILVYVSLGIYFYFNKELRKNLKSYILIGAISSGLFVICWAVYSWIIDPSILFSFVSHNVQLGSEQFTSLTVYFGSFILNIAQLTRLFTFPMILLGIIAFRNLFKKRDYLIDILLITSLVIIGLFIIVPRPAFGYPRYFMSILPGVFIIMGTFIHDYLTKRPVIGKKIWSILIISAIISLGMLILLKPQLTVYNSKGLIQATNAPDFLFNILCSIPLLFALVFKKIDRRFIFIGILIALSLTYCLYFDVKLGTYKSSNKEAGEYIKQNTDINDSIIVSKAVGYYAERRFYLNDDHKPPINISSEFIIDYIKKSYYHRNMDDPFFWEGKEPYSLYPPFPTKEDLDKAKYLITYYQVPGMSAEKKFGELYLYRLVN